MEMLYCVSAIRRRITYETTVGSRFNSSGSLLPLEGTAVTIYPVRIPFLFSAGIGVHCNTMEPDCVEWRVAVKFAGAVSGTERRGRREEQE